MYRSLSFFGKLVSFILLVVAMVILKNYNVFLLICGMVFILSFINKEKKYFIFCFLLFLATYFVNYNEVTFIIFKVLLVCSYALIIESSLLSLEKRYLYDKLFYRNSTSKKLRGYMKKYYYKDIVDKNIENNKRIGKYLEDENKYNKYLTSQAEKKAEIEVDNIYLIDRIRFDRFFSKKKSRLSFSWNNYDNVYICVSLLLFVIVLVLGR